MDSQPVPSGIATNSGSPADASDTVDSQDGVPLPSGNWWDDVASVNLKTVQTGDRRNLVDISLGGRRCLVTGETVPSVAIRMCHLIPKAAGRSQIRRFQYTFGRKLNLNSRWFNIFLRSDMHLAFDAANSGWALIPLAPDVRRIKERISVEKAYRKQRGIDGPWPDFRGEEWFPAKRSGYTYEFVPLGFKDEQVTITRYEWARESPAREFYDPPFSSFPHLQSHVHPYSVIINAVPKLRLHLDSLSQSITLLFPDLLFIHDVLVGATMEIPMKLSRSQGTPSRGSPSATIASGSSSPRSRRSKRLAGISPSPKSANSQHLALHPDSREPGDFDDLFDDSDDDANEPFNELDTVSGSILTSISAPIELGFPPKEEDKVSLPPFGASYSGSRQQTLVRWIAGVECARQQGKLVHPEDDGSLAGKQYAMEPSRPPPTHNWHDWVSEFAPWWVLLPKRNERGVISSNDWVEIQNCLPLTRKIDHGNSQENTQI